MTHISHFGGFPLKGEILVLAACVYFSRFIGVYLFCSVAMWMVFPLSLVKCLL